MEIIVQHSLLISCPMYISEIVSKIFFIFSLLSYDAKLNYLEPL